MKIYKYVLKSEAGSEQHVLINKGAEILAFRIQNSAFGSDPAIWALVDTPIADTTELRTFVLYFTGQESVESEQMYDYHIGTDIGRDGLVWHCFERISYGG